MNSTPLFARALPLVFLVSCSGGDPSQGYPSTGGTSSGASGGVAATGGSGGSGFGTGGDNATGGAASGGTGGGITTPDCTEPNSPEVCSNAIGQHCGLTYEFWTEGPGTGCMVNTAYGFQADWTKTGSGNPEFNYLARKGIRPGSRDLILTYEASDYSPEGTSYLSVYGWTKSPLIEYYIVESWNNYNPSSGAAELGTFESDGGIYKIYKTERVNKPSIEGTTTFWQFWSVRQEERTSGTITLSKHFSEWEKNGLVLGDFYEVSFVTEGYAGSGTADVKLSFQ
jgi:endo-1,4-beta-xylanase